MSCADSENLKGNPRSSLPHPGFYHPSNLSPGCYCPLLSTLHSASEAPSLFGAAQSPWLLDHLVFPDLKQAGPPVRPHQLHSWLLPFGFSNTELFNPETAHLSAFVPAVLSGKLHSATSLVISLALTCLLKLSSAITSSRRLTRLIQVVQGPPLGSHNPLCFGHTRAPTWLLSLFTSLHALCDANRHSGIF